MQKRRQHAYLQMSNTLDLDVSPQGQLVHSNAGPTLCGSRKIKLEMPFLFPSSDPKQKQKEENKDPRAPV